METATRGLAADAVRRLRNSHGVKFPDAAGSAVAGVDQSRLADHEVTVSRLALGCALILSPMVHLPIFSVEAPQLSYYRIGRISRLFGIAHIAPGGN
jgi:hypothetical protein